MPDIKTKLRLACLALVTLIPASILAQVNAPSQVVESAVCERYGITRVVELRAEAPAGVPCNVSYLKPDEGGTEEQLWLARNDASFCVSRYEGFLVKLETKLEWVCETQNEGDRDGPLLTDGSVVVEGDVVGSSVGALEEQELVEALDAIDTVEAADAIEAVDADDYVPSATDVIVAETVDSTESVANGAAALPDTAAVVSPVENEESVLALAGTEPELQAAIPEPSFPTDISQGATQQVSGELDFATVRTNIPSGFYSAHPTRAHEGAVQSCPADGYFVWNSQDQDKPVFEMGPVLEFAARLDKNSVVDTLHANKLVADISAIETLSDASGLGQETATSSAKTCTASVHYNSCYGTEARFGSGHWDTNDASFQCGPVASGSSNASAKFALFQNRGYSDKALLACTGFEPITHMALRPVSGPTDGVDVQFSGIELVIIRARGNNFSQRSRTMCRYVRG